MENADDPGQAANASVREKVHEGSADSVERSHEYQDTSSVYRARLSSPELVRTSAPANHNSSQPRAHGNPSSATLGCTPTPRHELQPAGAGGGAGGGGGAAAAMTPRALHWAIIGK